MKNVIGLAGAIGSGKTAVSDHLRDKYGATQLRYSQILSNVLDRLHLPNDRGNLQTLGESLRRSFGDDVVVNAFRKDLEACPAEIIVVDGIRYPNEVAMLRTLENNVLLFIDAPEDVRFKRALSRAEKGEAAQSFEDFVKAGSRETEKRLPEIKKSADYVLENDGTVYSLYSKVDAILAKRFK